MSFKLTKEHLDSFLIPTAQGDWSHFISAIDPEVHWVISDPVRDSETLSGTYNLQEWQDLIAVRLRSKLKDGDLQMKVDESEVIGNKAIIECSGTATQLNGKPYNNRYCWILIFSEDTGKIVDIREYLNTALVRETMTEN